MKHVKRWLGIVALAATTITAYSFSSFGGEGFEIFLDKKPLLQQFGKDMEKVRTIRFDPRSAESSVIIRYHHCGHVGKTRSIVIKNADNKTVQEWKFPDVEAANMTAGAGAMSIKLKSLIELQEAHAGSLKLVYYSDELRHGRVLAYFTSAGAAKN